MWGAFPIYRRGPCDWQGHSPSLSLPPPPVRTPFPFSRGLAAQLRARQDSCGSGCWGLQPGYLLLSECLAHHHCLHQGRMEGRNGEGTGTTESWWSRGEEPRETGPKDSLQNSHLCPGTASPPTLTLSVNVFVCLSSNPEAQLTGGEVDMLVSGPPSPSAVVNMCSPLPWAADTSHGPS